MHTRVLVAVLSLVLVGLVAALATARQTRPENARSVNATVLVTGANRGIGLEFARQLRAAGANVIGTARKPEEATDLAALGARVEQLDVADAASVAALAKRLEGVPIDLVVNNAGIFPRVTTIDEISMDDVERVFAVNCLGPMRVTRALLPNLRAGQRRQVVNISSRLGSIELNESGRFYGYRESKAALNMFTRTLAADLAGEGFTCVVMSPGWVRTDMGGPGATLSPEESVGSMVMTIGRLKREDSGRFLSHDGTPLPW